MKKSVLYGVVSSAVLFLSPGVFAQSSPGWVYGQVPTAQEWNDTFAVKQDVITSNSPLSINKGGTGRSDGPSAVPFTATGTLTARAPVDRASDVINVLDYGVTRAAEYFDGNMSQGSQVLSSASRACTSADVGAQIIVFLGASLGKDYATTVASCSGSNFVLTLAAGTVVTNGRFAIGQSQAAGFAAAASASCKARRGEIVIPAGVYFTTGVTICSRVKIRGAGSEVTYLVNDANSTSAVLKSQNFDTLVGTDTRLGVSDFSISGLTVNANKQNSTADGIDIYGWGYNVSDVRVKNSAGTAFYTEWGISNPSANWLANGLEAHVYSLKTHDSNTGIVWAGPHDSNLVNVESFGNVAKDIWFTPKAPGTTITQGHTYGGAQYGYYVEATGILFTGSIAESATIAPLMIGAGGANFVGGEVYTAGVANSACIKIGDATHASISAVKIDTLLNGCTNGGVDLAYSGGNNSIRVKSYQASGSLFLNNNNQTDELQGFVNGGGTGSVFQLGNMPLTAAYGYMNIGCVSSYARQNIITNSYLNSHDTLKIGVCGNGTASYWLSDGSVGIGTNAGTPGAKLDVGGMIRTSDTTPTLGACGTSASITGTDADGVITVGTGTVTSCAANFHATLANAPRRCTITAANATAANQGATGAYVAAADITTTGWVIRGTALAGAAFNYACQ